jgi:hypothetical protein
MKRECGQKHSSNAPPLRLRLRPEEYSPIGGSPVFSEKIFKLFQTVGLAWQHGGDIVTEWII